MSEAAPGPLIVVAGPTAVGKTETAVSLARLINGEIISADSMQVYRHLSIGTAKPTRDELQGVPYHLIDTVDPDHQYNAGEFVADAERILSEIAARHKRVVVCGGTGMYIRSLVLGMFEEPSRDVAVRQQLAARADTEGMAALYAELQRVDPSATHINPNDRVRIIRALEVFQVTGKPITAYHDQQRRPPRHPFRLFVLSMPRQQLYDRINRRVDKMMASGLLDEVQSYLAAGYSEDNPCIRALGYGDIISYLRNEISLREAVDAMKQKSRNYAKRQLTWFRAMPEARWLDTSGQRPQEVAQQISNEIA